KLDASMLTHDLRSIPQYARKAEAMGYDCLWSSETQHDPYLPLAVAATSTERIKLGTAIAVAFPRSPMITAYIAWDLQKASGGRGGLRRSARPPVQQPKISPRVCSSVDRRGHAQVRTQTRRFHVRDIDVCRGRRHQRGTGGEQAPGQGADRVLRFDADLPARS